MDSLIPIFNLIMIQHQMTKKNPSQISPHNFINFNQIIADRKMNKTIDTILNHSLNNSRTKVCHAFGRSDRFPKTFQSPCKRSAYDLESSDYFLNRSLNRSFGFGGEKKYSRFDAEIRRRSLSPSPGSYEFRDGFKIVSNKDKPSTFGKQKKMVLKVAQVPGPGKYEPSRFNPEVTLSYTMRTRTVKNTNHWNVAGPGQYNLKSSFSTKNSHSQCLKQSKLGRQKRFRVPDNTNPPPNAYHTSRFLTEPTSKYNQPQKYSFGRSQKGMKIRLEFPGPGTYREFSQFYEAPLGKRY